MTELTALRTTLKPLSSTERATQQAKFFKTGAGEYAEHDHFMGIRTPDIRKVVRQFWKIPLADISALLASRFNDERLCALLIAVERYQKCKNEREALYNLYQQQTQHVNNWNLVDSSAHPIVGAYTWERSDFNTLIKLAQSANMWERRIAIVATWHTIKLGESTWTKHIAELLLKDKHDLIHKATGWMLREMGKKDRPALLSFLEQHTLHMPRTMLRYAIEKLPKEERLAYLKRT